MENLAGNEVTCFLFRFDITKTGIEFVINESINDDILPIDDELLIPIVESCCQTLVRLKPYCPGPTLMDGNILIDGCLEVMLSKGLGNHLAHHEKQILFDSAKLIAEILMRVMGRA